MQIPDNLIIDLVKEEAGVDSVPLVMLIKGKFNVSEFKIAEKLGISVNHTRNMLYRLNEKNLTYSIRKKDKKKGWYIYYWTFNIRTAINTIIEKKQLGIRDARRWIRDLGKKREYFCGTDQIKYDEEAALESGFRCNECGEVLKEIDVDKKKKELSKRIKKYQVDLDIALQVKEYNTKREERKKELERIKEEKAKKAARKKVVRKKVVKKVIKKKIKSKKKVVKKTIKKKVVKKAKKVVKRKPVVKKVKVKPASPVVVREELKKKKGFLKRIFKKR